MGPNKGTLPKPRSAKSEKTEETSGVAGQTVATPTPAEMTDNGYGRPAKKAVCPFTREELIGAMEAILLTLQGNIGPDRQLALMPKEFSTGSIGWGADGGEKLTIIIGGKPIKCQVGFNLTIVNSKDLPGYIPKEK